MVPVIGEVYDVSNQDTLFEVIAIDKMDIDNFYLVVNKINRKDHNDTKIDELKISKKDFDTAKVVNL